MQGKGQTPIRLSVIAALALLAGAVPLAAQSASDYRLPGATSSPTSRAAGPVDPTDPTITAPRPRASATPSSAPPVAAGPSPAPSASAAPRPAAIAPRPAPSRAAPPTLAPQLPARATPQPAPLILPPVAETAAPLPSPGPATPVIMPTPQANPAPENSLDWRPWLAAAAALLAAIGAVLLWRRRRPAEVDMGTFEPPVAPAPRAEPAAQPAPAAPEPIPAPAAPAQPAGPLVLTLEARRLTASLMATTLSYTLRLTNSGPVPLADVAVEGDMVSAHSSLPVERQIASDAHRLELRHATVSLAPGESVEFSGDMRLPLDQITPIRAGDAAYFVPLARFRIESGGAGPVAQVLVQTFVVGELPEQPGAALRPFRLDLGPRTYSQVGQRAVA